MKKNVKRAAVIFMVVLMLVTAMPLNGILGTDLFAEKASAEELAPTGQCGENAYWTFDSETGLLTISGEGEMSDYLWAASPFYKNPSIKTVDIENGVTNIGNYAFISCNNIMSVLIPESITSIGTGAFENCSELKTITIPANVDFIGDYAFVKCAGLTSIIVSPDNDVYDSRDNCNAIIKTSLNNLLFGCRNTSIPDSIKEIAWNAFSGQSSLTNIIIPDGVSSIGSYAFVGCEGLTSVILPDSVTYLGGYAFEDCKNLKSVKMSKNINELKNRTFGGCTNLTDITIPDSVTVIGNEVFDECKNLKNINIPDGVTSIGRRTFRGCKILSAITSLGKIKSIDDELFRSCYCLESITIPDGIISIGSQAFEDCKALESIAIPDSVTSIGNRAYINCINLKDVYYSGTESQWNDITVGGDNNYLLNANIHFSDGRTIGTCGENIDWTYDESNGNLVVSGTGAMDSYESFDDYSWYSFKDDINYVEFSDGITSIGANAFNGCTALKEVYFGKNTAAIGENVFADCTNLSIVTVTSDKFTAENAFSNNSSRLTFVVADGNTDAESFAENNGYFVITVGYSEEDNTIDFKGNTVVYKGLQYNYLTNYINRYSYAEYIHFDRLEFDGVLPDVIFIENCENIVTGIKNFALDDLYVSLKAVVDGREEQITFEKMFELLGSGNYDAFKLKFQSESGETEESFFEKVADFFVDFYTSALRVITKAINFVVGLFKKK